MIFTVLDLSHWVTSAAADPYSWARLANVVSKHKEYTKIHKATRTAYQGVGLLAPRSHAYSLSQGHHMKRCAAPGCAAKGGVPGYLSHVLLDNLFIDPRG